MLLASSKQFLKTTPFQPPKQLRLVKGFLFGMLLKTGNKLNYQAFCICELDSFLQQLSNLEHENYSIFAKANQILRNVDYASNGLYI